MTKAILSLLFAGSFGLFAQSEWPEWRGPNGNGAFSEGKIPASFNAEGESVAWKIELPGRACSTPAIAKGLIFLTAPKDDKDTVLAYDLEGKEKWHQSYSDQTPGRGQRVGSGANSSCVSNGEVVVAYFKSGLVVGVSHDGKKLWDLNLHKKYGKDTLWWDQGTSPVLAGGNVVIAVMQTEGNSYLVSLNLKTGEEVWKTERKYETEKESGDSYTTPHVVDVDGVETIVTFGADHVTGHNAKSGKLLWEFGGINPETKPMWRTIASSVITNGIIIVPHGRGDFLSAHKIGGSGDTTKSHFLWRKEMPSADAATPIAHDGRVYLLIDRGKNRGQIYCIDAKTGEVIWNERLPKSSSTFYASPILIGHTLCCPREDGVVFTAKLTDKGITDVKENKLGNAFIASPVAHDGKLILRGDKYLWCLK